jgi:hypothetical protein
VTAALRSRGVVLACCLLLCLTSPATAITAGGTLNSTAQAAQAATGIQQAATNPSTTQNGTVIYEDDYSAGTGLDAWKHAEMRDLGYGNSHSVSPNSSYYPEEAVLNGTPKISPSDTTNITYTWSTDSQSSANFLGVTNITEVPQRNDGFWLHDDNSDKAGAQSPIPGGWMRTKLQISDGWVYAKHWAAGNPEPSGWEQVFYNPDASAGYVQISENVGYTEFRLSKLKIVTNADPAPKPDGETGLHLSQWSSTNRNLDIGSSPDNDTFTLTSPRFVPTTYQDPIDFGEGDTLQVTVNVNKHGGGGSRVGVFSGSGTSLQIYPGDGHVKYENSSSSDWFPNTFGDYGGWVNIKFGYENDQLVIKTWGYANEEPTGWGKTIAAPGFEGKLRLIGDNSNDAQISLSNFTITPGTKPVRGVVRTLSGDPVPNATVKLIGVNHEEIAGPSPGEVEARASDLLDRVEDAMPRSWNPDLNVKASIARGYDSKYAAVSAKDISRGPAVFDSASLDAQLRLPPKQPLVFTAWDMNGGSALSNSLDQYDRQLPGTIDGDKKIVVKELGPTGAVTGRAVLSPDESVGGGFLDATGMNYAEYELNPGFYRVHPREYPETAYTVVVGNPQEVFTGFKEDLRDRAGELTDRAEFLREQLESGTFEKTTVATDANGTFTAETGSRVKTVAVTAYKGPLEELRQDPAAVSMADIRALYESTDTTEATYMPTSPERVSPPTGGVTVRVREATATPNTNLTDISDIRDLLTELYGNKSFSELSSFLQNKFTDKTKAELEDVYAKMAAIRGQNAELEARLEELLDNPDTLASDQASREELTGRIQALQQAMTELRSSIPSGDPQQSVGEDTVSVSFPFETQLSSDQVLVVAQFTDGGQRVLSPDSEYVHIEENTLGGATVHVDEFPLRTAQAGAVNFKVNVATNDGIGRASETVRNPGFEGDLPSIDAISVSSLRPGPDDQVTLTIKPAPDVTIRNVSSVTVYGPSGQAAPVTRTGRNSLRFSTTGPGVHTVEASFVTAAGDSWTITQSVTAADQTVDLPPGLRLTDSPYGAVAVTGTGIPRGDVDIENGGERVAVTAQFQRGNLPVEPVKVYTTGLGLPASSDLTVRLVEGTDGRALDEHKRVTVYLPQMTNTSDSGLFSGLTASQTLYRNGKAMPRGSSQHGRVYRANGSLIITTYTDANGELSLQTTNTPGIIQSVEYQLDLWLQSLPTPDDILPGVSTEAASLPVLFGFLLAANRTSA